MSESRRLTAVWSHLGGFQKPKGGADWGGAGVSHLMEEKPATVRTAEEGELEVQAMPSRRACRDNYRPWSGQRRAGKKQTLRRRQDCRDCQDRSALQAIVMAIKLRLPSVLNRSWIYRGIDAHGQHSSNVGIAFSTQLCADTVFRLYRRWMKRVEEGGGSTDGQGGMRDVTAALAQMALRCWESVLPWRMSRHVYCTRIVHFSSAGIYLLGWCTAEQSIIKYWYTVLLCWMNTVTGDRSLIGQLAPPPC